MKIMWVMRKAHQLLPDDLEPQKCKVITTKRRKRVAIRLREGGGQMIKASELHETREDAIKARMNELRAELKRLKELL